MNAKSVYGVMTERREAKQAFNSNLFCDNIHFSICSYLTGCYKQTTWHG